jgi:hypothetical protein
MGRLGQRLADCFGARESRMQSAPRLSVGVCTLAAVLTISTCTRDAPAPPPLPAPDAASDEPRTVVDAAQSTDATAGSRTDSGPVGDRSNMDAAMSTCRSTTSTSGGLNCNKHSECCSNVCAFHRCQPEPLGSPCGEDQDCLSWNCKNGVCACPLYGRVGYDPRSLAAT